VSSAHWAMPRTAARSVKRDRRQQVLIPNVDRRSAHRHALLLQSIVAEHIPHQRTEEAATETLSISCFAPTLRCSADGWWSSVAKLLTLGGGL
jgi:hypothetical protein